MLIGVSCTVEARFEAVTTTSSSWLGVSPSETDRARAYMAQNIVALLDKAAIPIILRRFIAQTLQAHRIRKLLKLGPRSERSHNQNAPPQVRASRSFACTTAGPAACTVFTKSLRRLPYDVRPKRALGKTRDFHCTGSGQNICAHWRSPASAPR